MGASPSAVRIKVVECPPRPSAAALEDDVVCRAYYTAMDEEGARLTRGVGRKIDILPRCRMQAWRRDDPRCLAEILVFDDAYYEAKRRLTHAIEKGIRYFPTAYEGEWSVDGVPEGFGALLYSNGDCYIGEVECGCPWGLGMLIINGHDTDGLALSIGTFEAGRLQDDSLNITLAAHPGSSERPLVVARRGGREIEDRAGLCGKEDDEGYWYHYDYNHLLASVVEAAEGCQAALRQDCRQEEAWEDIIPHHLIIVEGPSSGSPRIELILAEDGTPKRLSDRTLLARLHAFDADAASFCVRLVPLPAAPPKGVIHLRNNITVKRYSAWVNCLTRLCRMPTDDDDDAADVVKIYGVYRHSGGSFYLVTQCFLDADGRPLDDIHRVSTAIANEGDKRDELGEEWYGKAITRGNSVNTDADYALIFTYRLSTALQYVHHHGGVTFNGQLSFRDILIREAKDGLRVTPTVRAADYYLDTAALLSDTSSCLPPLLACPETLHDAGGPSIYRTWAPETVLQACFGPDLTAALMALLHPEGGEGPQTGQASDVWSLAAIAHYLSWSPVVAAETSVVDEDGVAVGREGGNAAFKDWEQPVEQLSLAQWSGLLAVLPRARHAGDRRPPSLLLAYDDGRRLKEQNDRMKHILNTGGEVEGLPLARRAAPDSDEGEGSAVLETSKEILEDIVRRVTLHSGDPDGRPSLSSLVEFIKKNMPAVDVASATLRKHYRLKAPVSEVSESATASAYDDNLRKVMDTTAATASRISSKLGESSTKFFSSFVG
ncbi:hypothetical protein FOZ62_009903, partial [Perkinsus olseni]